MFEYEDAVVGQEVFLKDRIGQLRQRLMGVWRVGEDDVELLVGPFEQVEHICSHHMQVLYIEPRSGTLYEICARSVDIDSGYLFGTTRDELEGDGTRAGEEVHNCTIFIIDIVVQYVEQSLLGHICRRTDRQVGRRIESPSLQRARDNTHKLMSKVSYRHKH